MRFALEQRKKLS